MYPLHLNYNIIASNCVWSIGRDLSSLWMPLIQLLSLLWSA